MNLHNTVTFNAFQGVPTFTELNCLRKHYQRTDLHQHSNWIQFMFIFLEPAELLYDFSFS